MTVFLRKFFLKSVSVFGVALIGICMAFIPLSAWAGSESTRHEAVQAMQPAGYWPADEGGGIVLHDLSDHANHGIIHHTPWREGMLDFTSAFQWCQVPFSDAWRGKGLSIGGWLFTRQQSYQRNGMLFMGLANPIRLWGAASLILGVRAGMELEVFGDDYRDAIGSLTAKDMLAVGTWQHVLYTWENGTAKLYLDGKLVRSADDIAFEFRNHPLLIGSDASWWMLHPPTSNSLNGSVRDLVLFNRALSAGEIKQLQTATRPTQTPWIPSSDAIMINGRELPLTEIWQTSAEIRYNALTQLAQRDLQRLRSKTEELQPVLLEMLDAWPTRVLAAELLIKLDRDKNLPLLRQRLETWRQVIADETATDEERAASALALATLRAEAKSAVPTLAAALQQELDTDGPRLPRVEDFLRNSLMIALIDIDQDSEAARGELGRALAKPILSAIDLSRPYLEAARELVEEEREIDAYFTFLRLQSEQKQGNREPYYSKGIGERDERGNTPNQRAYTPVATRDGITYTLGEGKSGGVRAVEPIQPEEFRKRVDAIAREYPDARDWRDPDSPHLYRVPITKTMPSGTEETAYLGGEDFILDGADEKVRGWSVAIDTAGYLHIVGGQHNRPIPGLFIPGSWEKLGLSRDHNSESFPNQMYFVSKRPHDISEFEFVGRRDNPRNIPAGYLNYMNWVQDHSGELFLYGRIGISGWQSWGMYHYDVRTRHWTPVGGDASDIVADALATHPDWKDYLHHNVRGHTPIEPGAKSVVWAWQPHFYNYCRDAWGIYFDKTNRMHLRMIIRGLDENGRIIDSEVYAWSDDRGKTFHRADGSPVALPLTVNPAPKHNANANSYRQKIYWDVYTALLKRAGF